MKGINDKPIKNRQEDEFSVKPYVEGLCSFVRDCDTPISIAIQGDWGCGKTSMMNMLKDSLEKESQIKCVWFDTWQYCQFHMETHMAISFMRHFVRSFEKEKEDSQLLGKAKNLLKALAVGTAKQLAGDVGAGAVEEAVSAGSVADFSEEVIELKKTFQDLIRSKTVEPNGRVLFFIDDLDRLQPAVAVELLEILKIFFDCEKCVFILAVDTEVVFQGIKEKYGDYISDEKAKSFFDKIIQLPFQLPVSHYKMDHMIEQILRIEINSYYDRDWYFRAVYLLTDGNPRSIKRLSNAFLLTDKVAESKGLYSERKEDRDYCRKVLLLLSGIQLNYPDAYNHIVFSSSYGFFCTFSEMEEGNGNDREVMREKLTVLKFPRLNQWTDRFLDVMLFFVSLLKEYIRKCAVYPFMGINEFCQIVDMDMGRTFSQPERDSELNDKDVGNDGLVVSPYDVYLFYKMDKVLSFHFHKKDVNLDELLTIDYNYRYSPKQDDLGVDWLFGIEFFGHEIFPRVYWNEEVLDPDKPWHENILCMQRNLAYWYGKLQEIYGKRRYRDREFDGKEFRVYSEAQADMLVCDLLLTFDYS